MMEKGNNILQQGNSPKSRVESGLTGIETLRNFWFVWEQERLNEDTGHTDKWQIESS